MKWHELLSLLGDEPVFSSSILRAGNISHDEIKVQLARWVKSGKLIQLRRGLYTLSAPYRKTEPHPFLIANRFKKASYVSLQSALSYHGLIPEYVPQVTSVTAGRPEFLQTPAGSFIFKHIRKEFFLGFRSEEVQPAQYAFIATPEKALLDLVYLTPRADTPGYLKELRLQNLGSLTAERLLEMAEAGRRPKLIRAARRISSIVTSQAQEET